MFSSPVDFLLKYLPQKLVSAGFVLLGSAAFSTAMAAAKMLNPCVHSVVLLFLKSLFGLVFFSPFIMKAGVQELKTSRPFLQMLRSLIICAAIALTYYTYRHLPLGMATSIGMTGPLFTALLSMLILKDVVSFQRWLLIILGYMGVIIVVRPHEVVIAPGIWTGLLANLLVSVSVIIVKVLSRTESTVSIIVYSNVVATLISGLLAFFLWEEPLSKRDLMIIMAIGGLGIFSHFCSVSALHYASPSFVAPFEYTRLCFAFVIGMLFFEEPLSFWVLLGSSIIIFSTYLLTRLELKMPAGTKEG